MRFNIHSQAGQLINYNPYLKRPVDRHFFLFWNSISNTLDTFHIVKTSSRSPLFAFLLPAVSYMRFRDLPRSSSPLRLFSVTWFITRWRCLGLWCETRLWFCVRDTTILKAEHKATERNPKSVGSRLVSFASNKFSYLLQLPYSRYYDSLETEIFTLENQDHVSSLVWLQILWIAKELFLRGRNRERVCLHRSLYQKTCLSNCFTAYRFSHFFRVKIRLLLTRHACWWKWNPIT